MPSTPNHGFDISTVQKQYAMCKAQFEKTDYYKKFVAFFESALLQNQSPPITRILCLGKGSFSLGSIKTPNSYYQLAVVEVMLELLSKYIDVLSYQVKSWFQSSWCILNHTDPQQGANTQLTTKMSTSKTPYTLRSTGRF